LAEDYSFIQPNDGGEDVFVDAVGKAGLRDLDIDFAKPRATVRDPSR
jgi:hypothetical protein